MSSSERIAVLALVALASWLSASACSLSGDACIRMSDCADGFSCVEGTCLASTASSSSAATSTSADASAE